MKIKITNPNKLENVITKLSEEWPLAEECERFFSYGIPAIKEKLQKGETIFLETRIDTDRTEMRQYVTFWSENDIPTDEEFLKQKSK